MLGTRNVSFQLNINAPVAYFGDALKRSDIGIGLELWLCLSASSVGIVLELWLWLDIRRDDEDASE